jgi:hypothetical protein
MWHSARFYVSFRFLSKIFLVLFEQGVGSEAIQKLGLTGKGSSESPVPVAGTSHRELGVQPGTGTMSSLYKSPRQQQFPPPFLGKVVVL